MIDDHGVVRRERWIDVVGDRWDIFCTHSKVRVMHCCCDHCKPIRHPVHTPVAKFSGK